MTFIWADDLYHCLFSVDGVFQPCTISTAAQCHPSLCMWDPCLPAPLCSYCEYPCPSPDWPNVELQPLPVLRTIDRLGPLFSRMLRPSSCLLASRRERRNVLTTQPVASQALSLVSRYSCSQLSGFSAAGFYDLNVDPVARTCCLCMPCSLLHMTCISCLDVPAPDGGLYTATRYEFRSIPDIRRSRHPHSLRTEEAPMHWLNG